MTEDISFGKWLRQRRRMLDLSQQALADQVSCARITLSRIEAGTLKPSKELSLILLEKVGIPQVEREQWVRFARAQAGLPSKDLQSPASIKPGTNVPASLTSFIGREKEQAELVNLISKYRLITLTGSGGVGKTRLAMKVGEQILGDYSDGVWLVELAALNQPELLPQAIASVFEISFTASMSFTAQLTKLLHAKSILLILDNCEHILDTSAHLADLLLKKCSNLKILATSREALSVLGEVAYHVPSLGLPQPEKLLDKYREFESVRLFEERARLSQTNFTLTMETASSISQICNRLDGIPLAIELAAVHMDMYSPAEIAVQLDQRFDVLTGGNRTALPRQQTIRASIDWSWKLLAVSERILLRRLSIFAGGWTAESARVVCGDDRIKRDQVLDLVLQLVKKSLIVTDQKAGRETRYHFHEIIREYAHEKLVEAGEVIDIQNRHLQYFLKFSELAEYGLVGPQQMEWHNQAMDERGNLRAALNFSAQTKQVEAGLYIPSNLGRRFWENFDVREGLDWLTKFIQMPEANSYPKAQAKALFMQGALLLSLQNFSEARQSTEVSLAMFRAQRDQRGEIEVLLALGGIMQYLEGMGTKKQLQQEALELARSIGDEWREAKALGALGWDDFIDLQKAHEYWQEAIRLFRQVDDWRSLAFYLGALGESLVLRSEIEIAKPLLEEANEINQRMNNRRETEFVMTSYGYLAFAEKDYDQASDFFRENAKTMDELGNRMGYLWARARLGLAILRQGHIQEAGKILTQTLRDFYEDGNQSGVVFTTAKFFSWYVAINKLEPAAQLIGWCDMRQARNRPAIDQAEVDRDIAVIRANIGTEAYEEAYRKGHVMTLDEAVAVALKTEVGI